MIANTRATEHASVQSELNSNLHSLVREFLLRPNKAFRKNFVHLGYTAVQKFGPSGSQTSENVAKQLLAAGEAIERLHAGSLIVDDIEDQSEVRRGSSTLHLLHGIPRALNAGNWLYFSAFKQLSPDLFPSSLRLRLIDAMNETLLDAHEGQGLDLGVQMDSSMNPTKIIDICQASLLLKSGALFRLALEMGALIGEASPMQIEFLRASGLETGLCLQAYDDVGNLNLERPTPKHLEDLKLRRPSFLWWSLAQQSPQDLEIWSAALEQLPELKSLREVLEKTDLKKLAREHADSRRSALLRLWSESSLISKTAFTELKNIFERIANAYG